MTSDFHNPHGERLRRSCLAPRQNLGLPRRCRFRYEVFFDPHRTFGLTDERRMADAAGFRLVCSGCSWLKQARAKLLPGGRI